MKTRNTLIHCTFTCLLISGVHNARSNDVLNGLRVGPQATTNTVHNSSVAIGEYNSIGPAMNSISIGTYNSIYDPSSASGLLLLGDSNSTSNVAIYSLLAGQNHTLFNTYYSAAFGSENVISGSMGVLVAGEDNQSFNAIAGAVFGKDNRLTGTSNFLSGSSNSITVAVGPGFDSASIFGRSNTSSANASFTAGSGLINQSYTSTIVGAFNKPIVGANGTSRVLTDGAFVVGNGSGPNTNQRSNAFVVLKNGNAEVSGTLTVGGSPAITVQTAPTVLSNAFVPLLDGNAAVPGTLSVGGSPAITVQSAPTALSGTILNSLSLSTNLKLGTGSYNGLGTVTPNLLLGTNNVSWAQNTAAIGTGNSVGISMDNSLMVGENNGGNGHHMLFSGLGNGCSWNAAYCVAGGSYNGFYGTGVPGVPTQALNSAAFGVQNVIAGQGNVALGWNNDVRGTASGAFGYQNKADNWKYCSLAFGLYNNSKGDAAVAIGELNTTNGRASVALGKSNITDGDGTIASGTKLTGKSFSTVYLGSNNQVLPQENDIAAKSTFRPTDPILVVGNGSINPDGSPGTPSNALIIYKNGDLDVSGRISVSPSGDLGMGAFQ